jgi:hypothetical protein
VNKFDGSDPIGWVTQMEHYFSLHGITDDLAKLHYGILHMDLEHYKWWQWLQKPRQGYYFIVAFEHLDFKMEGMLDAFFREFFINDIKDEICAHVLMAHP